MTGAGLLCASCGTELRRDAKFCDECGAPVTSDSQPAEYKQVTVLFADVVRSMDIAASLGPERLREIMTELVSRSAAVVQRFGGTVDKFTGDGVMALFGAPVALEDHAFRACLAALGIQDEVARLAEQVHRQDGGALLLRVGLNSGQVIAGEIGAGPRGYTAIGEQVGLAQRMESAAPPGEVMLSESTARLVESSAALGEPEMVHIKGSNKPVQARRLLGVPAERRQAGRWKSSLVGRQWELGTLAGALTQAVDGQGCVVEVAGPAGIGKSRLVSELATTAASRGIDVFSAFCESHTGDIPFHVVTRLLRAATRVTDLDGAAARAKVRALAPHLDADDLLLLDDVLGIADPAIPLPVVDPDGRRRRLAAAINAAVLARETPAVYVIEDAHWIDKVSESMLVDFLAAIPQTHTLALITYRSEYRGALARSAGSHTISLAPLNASHCGALITELLGSHPSVAGIAAQIAERAAGNPFFAEEMVRELAERGAIHGDRGGYVCHDDIDDLFMPATLQSTIAARIDRLAPGAKRALGAASVIGSRFDPDLLDDLGVDPALDELVGAELIDRVGFTSRAEYGFRHPLIRAVAYESQLKADRAELHRRAADAIEARGSPDEDAALIAEHREASGELDAAYSWHMRAGTWSTDRDVAAARTSWQRAERIARAALERGGGVRAALLLSRALLWLGHAAEAEEVLARFAPEDLDELQLAHWGVSRLSILFWAMGDVGRAHEVLAVLRERVVHPRARLVVDAIASGMAVHENKISEGLAAAEQVLSDPYAPKPAVDFAAFSAGLAMPVAGRGGDFEPIAARCRAEQDDTDVMIRILVLYCDVLALTYIGDLDLADKRAADYADFASAGQFLGWAVAKIRSGLVATHRGKFPDAISSIEEALTTMETEAPLPWRLPARVLLARAYAGLGRVDDAEHVLADAGEHAGPFVALHAPQVTIAESWLAAAKGFHHRAVELARAAADAARESGQYAVEAEALHHAARFGDHTVAGRLEALSDRVQGRLVPLYARHADALATSDGQALDAVSAEFEGVGLLLSATDSAAQAALLHKDVGQRHRSLGSAARARRLAAECGGATTPAIESLAHDLLSVTSRERQIADSQPPTADELRRI
jgi:class 3 adenylate cyclase